MTNLLAIRWRKLVAGAAFSSLAVVALLYAARPVRSAAKSAAADQSVMTAYAPKYTADGKLERPANYRRWTYVSSGFGMSYNPEAGGNGAPPFTNVFVPPPAYDYFEKHGTWPDKTMFVLEVYSSNSKGSINLHGSYQDSLRALDVEVKDESHFPDKWAYFGFGNDEKASAANTPGQNRCWTCHNEHAAVEFSFVQFYPELLKIAKEKGTIKSSVELGK